MKIKALVGFAGVLTMKKGEILEYGDKAVLQDLLKAKYIEEVKKDVKSNENKRNRD